MERILLIDGSGLLVANYYGTVPPEVMHAKTDHDKEKAYEMIFKRNGYYANAIYPTIKQIYEMAIKSNCNYIGVAFDKSRKTTFRTKMYSEYKGTRPPSPAPLNQQFVLCENMLADFGIPVFYSDEFEADDLIGSIAKQYTSKDIQAVLYTRDKDYLQLVDENITVWMGVYKDDKPKEIISYIQKQYEEVGLEYDEYLPDKTIPYYPCIVEKEKGVKPQNYYHVLALVGDTADNIPGVKGVSEAVAEKLIAKYENLDNLYKEVKEYGLKNDLNSLKKIWKDELDIKRSPITALVSQESEARLSDTLAKIKTDIDMNDFVKDFSINTLKCPNSIYDLEELCKNNNAEFRNQIKTKTYNYIDNIDEIDR
jgi:DNA polymerase-1